MTTYAYEFNDENAPDLFAPMATFPLGAYQGSEIQYLFNFNERFTGTNPFTRQQQALSNSMISYWTTFATNADPNSPGRPVWSPYSSWTVARTADTSGRGNLRQRPQVSCVLEYVLIFEDRQTSATLISRAALVMRG